MDQHAQRVPGSRLGEQPHQVRAQEPRSAGDERQRPRVACPVVAIMAPTSARGGAATVAHGDRARARLPSQAARAASASSAVATPSRRFSTTRWVNAATSRQASCAGRPSVSAASHSRDRNGPNDTVSSRARGTAVPLGSASKLPRDVRRQDAHLGAHRQVAEAGEELGHLAASPSASPRGTPPCSARGAARSRRCPSTCGSIRDRSIGTRLVKCLK